MLDPGVVFWALDGAIQARFDLSPVLSLALTAEGVVSPSPPTLVLGQPPPYAPITLFRLAGLAGRASLGVLWLFL